MMNNHGISIREMALLLCILLFCLFMACFYGEMFITKDSFVATKESNVTGVETGNVESKKDDNEGDTNNLGIYKKYESKMIDATKRYMKFYNYEAISDDIIVTLNSLIELGFIEKMYDDNTVCSGYVRISDDNGSFNYNEFLECPNYKTVK